MGDAHGGVGCVDALSTMSTRTEDVDAQVIGVDLNVGFFGLWEDCDGGG